MRGLTNSSLGRRHAKRGAHGSIEKGVASRLGRPDSLVEARDDDNIEIQQSRFKQAENLDARVARRWSPDRRFGNDPVEQIGVFTQVERLAAMPMRDQLGQRLIEFGATIFVIARGAANRFNHASVAFGPVRHAGGVACVAQSF